MWRAALWVVAIVILLLIAGVLFVADREMPREEMVAMYGGPPSQFITLPSGATAHYRDRGHKDAATLVLLPALNDSLYQWEQWSETLSDTFRIVTVDLPGQGLTIAAPDEDYSYERVVGFVDEVTAALGLKRFALGGNSFGGFMAVHYAIERPGNVTHLVLVGAAGIEHADNRPPAVMVIAQTPVVRELLRAVPMRPVFASYLKEMIADDQLVTDALIDRYWDLNRGRATVQLKRLAILGARSDTEDRFLRDHLSEIEAPTLVLGGMEDHGTPPSTAKLYATGVRNGRLILYSGVGHFAMIEKPERSAADVRAFLSGTY